MANVSSHYVVQMQDTNSIHGDDWLDYAIFDIAYGEDAGKRLKEANNLFFDRGNLSFRLIVREVNEVEVPLNA